jgi:hypothetical protein
MTMRFSHKEAMPDGHQFGFDLGEKPRDPDAPLFDPDAIRRDALAIIEEARAVNADAPWDAAEIKYRRIMFPHLVSWIPNEEERNQLCFTFMREIERIELLIAA